ncbi:hypothetical protein ABPG75_011517 [Micractinium tetrahymenae]
MHSHGGVFKTAAVEVLRRTRRLMTTGEICRLALEWGLLSCQGKTPEATMASALYGDIKRKGGPSLFIRPHHGMFGLLEWVQNGSLALWQLEAAATALPSASSMPTLEPAYGGSSSFAGVGSTSAGFAGSSSGVAVLPLAAAAAVAVTPAKRGAPGNGSAQQQQRGPGRPKKARRSEAERSDGEDEEWSDGDASLSDSGQRDDSEDERLEPRQYSLRKGQVGRLHEAMAAAAPPPLSQQQQQQQQAQLGSLEPLELPNLRPQSAEDSAAQQRATGRRSSDGGGLLSPPLYAALLQSPLVAPASSAGRPGHLASLLSPGTALPAFRSPMLASPLLAAMGRMSAGLPGLLSPLSPPGAAAATQPPASAGSSLQRKVVPALKGTAVAAAAGPGGSASGTTVPAMVPIVEPAALLVDLASGLHSCQGPHLLPILQLQHGVFGQRAGQQQGAVGLAMVGESAGMAALGDSKPAGARPGHMSIPEIVFKLPEPAGGGCKPVSSASSRGRGTGGVGAAVLPEAAAAAGGEAPSTAEAASLGAPSAAAGAPAGGVGAQIARKIREVEGKVAQVEERWGPLSLKTAQAHFLLHHACRHPLAAAAFQREAAQALQRARTILQQSRQLGLEDCQGSEYVALLSSILEAGAAAGERGGDAEQAAQLESLPFSTSH